MFSCQYYKIFKDSFSCRTPQMTVSFWSLSLHLSIVVDQMTDFMKQGLTAIKALSASLTKWSNTLLLRHTIFCIYVYVYVLVYLCLIYGNCFFFIATFFFITINHIISLTQKNLFFGHFCQKFSLSMGLIMKALFLKRRVVYKFCYTIII